MSTETSRDTRTAQGRMPVVYLPHGGGPWPFVELPFMSRAEVDSLAGYLRSLGSIAEAARLAGDLGALGAAECSP